MTLSEFQTALHNLYRGDNSTPTSSDAEWSVRLDLLKAAISAWESEDGIFWNELYTTLASASDGDKTINASDLIYDMPTDFRFLTGHVRTYTTDGNETYWTVISPELAATKENRDPKECYVVGNKKTGFDLHFLAQPTASDTLEYPYYKEAFEPSDAADVIEMSDPYFAVYLSLAVLLEQDGEGDRANLANLKANERLRAMRTKNQLTPHFNANPVQDGDYVMNAQGFGV